MDKLKAAARILALDRERMVVLSAIRDLEERQERDPCAVWHNSLRDAYAQHRQLAEQIIGLGLEAGLLPGRGMAQ